MSSDNRWDPATIAGTWGYNVDNVRKARPRVVVRPTHTRPLADSDDDLEDHAFLDRHDTTYLATRFGQDRVPNQIIPKTDEDRIKKTVKLESTNTGPQNHALEKSHGVLFRHTEAHSTTLNVKTTIKMWHVIGFATNNKITCQRTNIPWNGTADAATTFEKVAPTQEMLGSETMRRLHARWPVMVTPLPGYLIKDANEKKHGYNKFIDANPTTATFCFTMSCLKDNSDVTTKKYQKEITNGVCKCGAVTASVAKGWHEDGSNEHLKRAALLPHAVKIDALRAEFVSEGDRVGHGKRTLCLFLRLFIQTSSEDKNRSKYVLIGTDQRSSVNHGSEGCHIGIPALCKQFLSFLLGRYDEDDFPIGEPSSSESWSVMQVMPTNGMAIEERFKAFYESCLTPIKDSHRKTAEGKLRLCYWMNAKGAEEEQNGGEASSPASTPATSPEQQKAAAASDLDSEDDDMDVGEEGSVDKKATKPDDVGYRSVRLNNMVVDFNALVMIRENRKFRRDRLPDTAHPHDQYVMWTTGEIMDSTIGVNYTYDTFYQKTECVRGIFGEGASFDIKPPSPRRRKRRKVATPKKVDSNRGKSKTGRKYNGGVTTTIACHRVHYYMPGDSETPSNVLMLLQAEPAYKTKVVDLEVTVYHTSDVTVHENKPEWQNLLMEVAEDAVGPIPKRVDQKFGAGGPAMTGFAPSTHTLLQVSVDGDNGGEGAGTVVEDVKRTGLYKLVGKMLKGTEDEIEAKEKLLRELQVTLCESAQKELHAKHEELGLDPGQAFDIVLSAQYRQSRFDTALVVRPAPYIDASPFTIHELQVTRKTFIKDYILTGPQGLWVRVFKDGFDGGGQLIKIEPDTILGIPFTAPKEVGRINHIEGNPHFVIRVILMAGENGEKKEANLGSLGRYYPHVPDTMAALQEKDKEEHDGDLSGEWERTLRTVQHQKLGLVKPKLAKCDVLGNMLKTVECVHFDRKLEL
jgi:hypothetical protein